jgi:hypothetical protein
MQNYHCSCRELRNKQINDQVARQVSSSPFIGPEPALGISAKVARKVIRGWMNRKCAEYWQSVHVEKKAKGLLRRPSAKRAGEILNLSRSKL